MTACVVGCSEKPKSLPRAQSPTDEADDEPRVALEMLGELEVTDVDGGRRKVKEFGNGKNLVLVVSRGYYGAVCPFCSAQVQRLASQHDRIKEAGGQVLVVFPIEKFTDVAHRGTLVDAAKRGLEDAAAKLPFEIVTDPELGAVDQLDIRADLSKPAT